MEIPADKFVFFYVLRSSLNDFFAVISEENLKEWWLTGVLRTSRFSDKPGISILNIDLDLECKEAVIEFTCRNQSCIDMLRRFMESTEVPFDLHQSSWEGCGTYPNFLKIGEVNHELY